MYGIHTTNRENPVGNVLGHGLCSILGLVLLGVGLLMTLSLILMPVGIVTMVVGAAALLWGMEEEPKNTTHVG